MIAWYWWGPVWGAMFQRTGHDYSLNDQDPAEWLHICYLDRRRLMETGMFGSRLIGSETDHVLWVR